MLMRSKFVLTGLTALLAAACSRAPTEGTAEHLLFSVEGAQALPAEALGALGAAALPYWTRCGDHLVTRDAGRDGEGEGRFVAAAPLRLQVTAAAPPPAEAGTAWRGVVHLSSGRYRSASPASQAGVWSDWQGLTALDLPVWTLHAEAGAWRAEFRPHADPDDEARYARQYTAPDCAALPPAPEEPSSGA